MNLFDIYNSYFFFNNVRFQIVSFIFLLILEILYFSRKKLPLLSTRIFTGLMICAFAYIISDFMTVYSIVFMERVPYWFLKLTHQVFIGLINTILLLIYLYVDVFNNNQKRYCLRKKIILFILCLATLLILIFGEISFYRGPDGVYSYGMMPITVYVIAFIIVIMTVVRTLKVSITSPFHSKQKYIYMIMGIWIISVLIQYNYPTILFSSIGITLIIFFLYLSLENPYEYMDYETSLFKQNALKMVLQEKTNKKKDFYILNVDIEDYDEIEKSFGAQISRYLKKDIGNYLNKKFKTSVFEMNKNSLTILVDKNEKKIDIDKYTKDIEERFKQYWKIGKSKFVLKTHCDFLEYPQDLTSCKTESDIISFIEDCHKFTKSDSYVKRVDKELVENRNRNSTILQIIETAIEKDGIDVFFQPIYNIKEKKFTNAEALVRLKDKETIGFISPEEFIPIVEKNGMIITLSNIIFEKVFVFLSKENVCKKGINHIEINLSGVQSIDSDLPNQRGQLLQRNGIEPSAINLEITESIAILSASMLKKNMNELKEIGFTFSMDDFGTGYSNLAQMVKVDYEYIKIDKSLLWPCFDENNKDRVKATLLLENIITMILNLGKEIIAEGVETKEQFDFLKKHGVNFIQGYYFSKPLCMVDYIKFVEEKNA